MKVIVIGGGPAGCMAASMAGKNGNETILLEANEKIGKKLYISGKGRCNLTNNIQPSEFLQKVVSNSKFLYSAINKFTPHDTLELFEGLGVKLKTERGNRVFPESDKSSDIIKAFQKLLNKNNVKVMLNCKVLKIDYRENKFYIDSSKGLFICDKLILTTGGKSYSSTGSKGDGYIFAKNLGHNIIAPVPALVPIKLLNYNGELAGLTLKNVSVKIELANLKKFTDFGEMLFTHDGVSGPTILSLSSLINRYDLKNSRLFIDFKPALSFEQLNLKFLRERSEYINKDLKTYLKSLLPISMVEYFVKTLSFDFNKKINSISKNEKYEIIDKLKNFSFNIDRLYDLDYAIVTSGGVDTKEIDSRTMQSKLIPNLFFAGELIDIDAFTGGFNIQMAISTGFIAGSNC